MADDLGWGEPGLYPATSKHGRIATPNLDQLGREGLVFTNAYAGYTVCAPSRTTFFTGRHTGSFLKRGFDGTDLKDGCGAAPRQVTTLASMLQEAGYTTGAFGKVAPLVCPEKQGFDTFIGQVDQALCHNMYPALIDAHAGTLNYPLTGNDRSRSRDLCMAHPEIYNYSIDVFHDSAMAWLREVAGGPKPFFMYLSFTIPHAGGWGDAPKTPEDGQPVPTDLQYASMDWPDVEKDHAAVITYLDGKVGDLLQQLKHVGKDENTIVFFASDNGAHQAGGHNPGFFNSTGGLKGHKRSLFEGGVRSPTMVRWPASIASGSTSGFPWAFWDVLPTFAELAGGQAPPGLDGMSIVPTLLGKEQPEHEFLYFTWEGLAKKEKEKLKAGLEMLPSGYSVRSGRWKGIVAHCTDTVSFQPSMDDPVQVYDLVADPFETNDIAAEQLHVAEMLKKLVVPKNFTCLCFQCSFHPGPHSTEAMGQLGQTIYAWWWRAVWDEAELINMQLLGETAWSAARWHLQIAEATPTTA